MGNGQENEIMSTREAAQYLDVSVRTIQLWVENGCLQAWKTPGGHRRILRQSVEDMMKSRQIHPAPNDFYEILICEDDDINCSLMELQFSTLGPDVRIRTVSNGYEALIQIGERCPHLLVTDLLMPNMDGMQMLEALQQTDIGQTMHVIVVTGLSDDEIEVLGGLPEGVNQFTKPIAYPELLQLISGFMADKKANMVS